jgi:hypothetical protein
VVAWKIPICGHVGADGDAYVAAVLRISWGNCGPTAACSPAGVIAPSAGASPRVATRAAHHRSMRAWREHWPERWWRQGVEVLTTAAWAGAGALVAGVAGVGPDPVDRHGWSLSRLVRRMR